MTKNSAAPAVQPDVQPILLTREQLKVALPGHSDTRIDALVRNNDVQSLRVGKRRLFVAQSVHDYISRELRVQQDRMLRPRGRTPDGKFVTKAA